MSGGDESASSKSKTLSARWAGVFFALLAVFAPAFVQIFWIPPGGLSFSVWAMVWGLFYGMMEPGQWYLDFSPFFYFAQSVIYIFLRPVFAYQMVRYYQGKSSRRWTIVTGIITELQVIVMNIPPMLELLHWFLLVRLPIPFMLFAAVLLMKYMPPSPKIITWIEKEQEHSRWWSPTSGNISNSGSSDSKTLILNIETVYKVLETILVSEIILFLIGGVLVTNLSPYPLQILYGVLIPWAIVITGLLFLIARLLRRKKSYEI
jgi:hypothetical protein